MGMKAEAETAPLTRKRLKIGKEINRGGEFRIFEGEDGDVIKICRFPRLMRWVFGDFRQKNEQDLRFLKSYFPQYLPATRIVDHEKNWAVCQERIDGVPLTPEAKRSPQVRKLFLEAEKVYLSTGKIPDFSNPRNLLQETGTGRLLLLDSSVLGGKRWWPIGYLVTRFLGKILFDTLKNRLRTGRGVF